MFLIYIYGLFFLFGLVKLISGYQNLKSTCPKGYQGFWNFASPASAYSITSTIGWFSLNQSRWRLNIEIAHMKVLGLRLNTKKSVLSHHREPLILVWCVIRPRCRHICPLLGSSRSSRKSGEWKKASHSLSSSFRDCWVWWQLRPMWYLLACCTWDPYSGDSRPRGSPRG